MKWFRIRELFVVFSIIPAVLLAVLWVRSHWVNDSLECRHYTPSPRAHPSGRAYFSDSYLFYSQGGQICLQFRRFIVAPPPPRLDDIRAWRSTPHRASNGFFRDLSYNPL